MVSHAPLPFATKLQPLASFVRETIPLQAAIGLARDGHLDESLRQGWLKIAFTKRLAILQLQEILQRLTGHFTLHDQEQLTDLGG